MLKPWTSDDQTDKKRVLVFADDSAYALVFHQDLTAAGYEVSIAWGTARFRETIKQIRPDLILLALENNQPTSLDLLPDIRMAYYDLPIILWSIHPSDKYDLRAVAADYFAPASPNLEELKVKIRMALEA